MSKGALKKAAKAGSTISQKYAPAFLISNIIFFILRVYWKYSTFNTSCVFGLILIWCLYGISYLGLVSATQSNISASIYFDLFGVTCATQCLVGVTGWAWYLLLVIPGYAAFSFIPGFFKSSPKPSTNAVDTGGEENDENSKKMKASDRLRLQRMKKH